VTASVTPFPVTMQSEDSIAAAKADNRQQRILCGLCPDCGVPVRAHYGVTGTRLDCVTARIVRQAMGVAVATGDPREPPHPPTEDDWERLAAMEGLANLIQKYSAKRVIRWVTNLAAIYGQEV